jgi:hypothetical protein
MQKEGFATYKTCATDGVGAQVKLCEPQLGKGGDDFGDVGMFSRDRPSLGCWGW